MRLTWAKGDRECKYCQKQIERGQMQVHISVPPKKTTRGYWMHLFYHKDCYLEYLKLYMNTYFTIHPNTQKKRGRRGVVTSDRKRRRQLMASYRYYRRVGNKEKMYELETQIIELSYGESPYHLTLATLQKAQDALNRAVSGYLTTRSASVRMGTVSSLTEYDATQVKGGCRSGDESDANGQMSEANCSAVQP